MVFAKVQYFRGFIQKSGLPLPISILYPHIDLDHFQLVEAVFEKGRNIMSIMKGRNIMKDHLMLKELNSYSYSEFEPKNCMTVKKGQFLFSRIS